jgi:hypothetical protein
VGRGGRRARRGHRERLVTLAGHAYGLYDGSWSPDDQFIVTTSIDRTARVWDAGTGDVLEIAHTGSSALYQTIFPRSADGTYVALGNFAAVVGRQALQAYRCEVCVSPDRLLELAGRRVTRSLTPAERQRYHIAK